MWYTVCKVHLKESWWKTVDTKILMQSVMDANHPAQSCWFCGLSVTTDKWFHESNQWWMNEAETVLHLCSSYSASETNVLNVTKQNAGKSINISHAKLHYLLDLSKILFFFPLHQTAFASGSITSTFEMQDTSSIMLNSLYSLMRSLVPSLKANFFAPWWLLGAKKTPKLTTMSMICTSWLNSASHLRHCASSVQI